MAQLRQLNINLFGALMLLGSGAICLYLTRTIAMMARLHQPHPHPFADQTNVAWIGADGFTLPWVHKNLNR
jgi:hypothetical protein